jgi:DNA primase
MKSGLGLEETMTLFETIKQTIALADVLSHYGVNVTDNRRIPCPIHGGEDANFAINLATNTWHCFSQCATGGDVIALVTAIERVRPVEAAQLLATWFPGREPLPPKPPPEPLVLRPVGYTLELDQHHPAVTALGMDAETAHTFGIGFASSGEMAGRVAFPVHDPRGAPVGYVGRAAGQLEPKYRISKGLATSLTLYNLHRIDSDWVVVVEGARDVWALHKAGYPAVAPIGAHLSAEQCRLLSPFRRVIVMFDGDSAGRNAAALAVGRLASATWCRIVPCPDGHDPADLSPDELKHLVTTVL